LGSLEEAEAFLQWLPDRPNPITYAGLELLDLYNQFVKLYVCECGGLRDPDDENTPAPTDGQRYCCTSCKEKKAKKCRISG
jgi:hypothetical protein